LEKKCRLFITAYLTLIYVEADGSSIFKPNNGEVKLIDNNNDGKIEVVSVLSYDNLVFRLSIKQKALSMTNMTQTKPSILQMLKQLKALGSLPILRELL